MLAGRILIMPPEIAAPVAEVPYWTYLIPVIIAAIGMVQVVALAFINSKAKSALTNTEETKISAAATAESVEKVHTAVNSERTAMLAEVKALRDEILRISTDKARLEQSESDRKGKE